MYIDSADRSRVRAHTSAPDLTKAVPWTLPVCKNTYQRFSSTTYQLSAQMDSRCSYPLHSQDPVSMFLTGTHLGGLLTMFLGPQPPDQCSNSECPLGRSLDFTLLHLVSPKAWPLLAAIHPPRRPLDPGLCPCAPDHPTSKTPAHCLPRSLPGCAPSVLVILPAWSCLVPTQETLQAMPWKSWIWNTPFQTHLASS